MDAGERFDFIAILGFYYHTMEHFRFLDLARQLQADTIMTDNPVIRLAQQSTDKVSKAVASFQGQDSNVIGIPSAGAPQRLRKSELFFLKARRYLWGNMNWRPSCCSDLCLPFALRFLQLRPLPRP
ncbi:hypothetical protein PGB28_08000 [Primorskyibacter aestuariivivens]|uniref:hypothetical protein n=1 Tax=Primorskyibacter aestuariivivens TaxID=1888912 RepID=UPI002301486A|nr:hypothetical protein [Primorskyibacter aestuariivivens]MDA7428398.1 hypothetical protein [Primorskyibacter aestuariivivens]